MNSDARVPVAQSLRMSSGHQHYSLESQSSAIGMYAESHGFSVIQTYTDAAKTGVVFRERKGLQQLIQDVVQRAVGAQFLHGRYDCGAGAFAWS